MIRIKFGDEKLILLNLDWGNSMTRKNNNIPEQLKQVEQYIERGEFRKALQNVETIVKFEKLTDDNQLTCKLLKSRTFLKMNNYEKGLEQAEQVFAECQVLGKQVLIVDAIILIAEALRHLDKLDESLEKIEFGEQVLTTMMKERLAPLNLLKSIINLDKGKQDLAVKYIQNSLTMYNELSQDYWNKGDLEWVKTVDKDKRLKD